MARIIPVLGFLCIMIYLGIKALNIALKLIGGMP